MTLPGNRRTTLFLLALFGLAAVSILGKSLFDSDGYLFDDSTQYLKLARSLVDGRGFYTTPCDYESDKSRVFFAVWPVGYPVLIALAAKATGSSVFWASKLANLAFVALLFGLFRRFFGRAAPACATVLLFAPFLEIYAFTMSEAPFILALVAFCLALDALVRSPDPAHAAWAAGAALLLFLLRYIGAFAIGICFLLALQAFLLRRRPAALWLAAAGAAALVPAALYLALNAALSGSPTGLARSPSFFTLGERASALVRSLAFLANPMALEPLAGVTRLHAAHYAATGLLLAGLIALFRRHTRREWNAARQPWDSLTRVLVLTGAVDWLAVLVMHGTAHIDLFSYRLFAPGGLLFLLALVRRLERTQSPRVYGLFANGLLAVALVAYAWHGPMKMIKHRLLDGEPGYAETLRELDARYAAVPPGSAVIGGSNHLNYRRPDLRILYPYHGPRRVAGRMVFYAETLDELLRRAASMPYAHVVLDAREIRLNRGRMHESFTAFAERSPEEWVLIR